MSIAQKSQIALEYDKILNELVKFAKTEQSKKLCLNLVPFANFNEIEEQLIYARLMPVKLKSDNILMSPD